MSIEINNTKKLYQKVFLVELVLFVFTMIGCYLFDPEMSKSVLFGFLVAFIPHLIFTLFFIHKAKKGNISNKLSVLFQGEGIKLLLTILGCIIVFKYSIVKIGVFFAVFFATLLFNGMLPILLNKK